MQNEEQKLEIVNYIERASIVILGLLFILFPVFLTNLTTDYFILPKQALVIFACIAVMILYGVKTLLLEKVRIRRTPFDLAVILILGRHFVIVNFFRGLGRFAKQFYSCDFCRSSLFWHRL